MTSFSATVVLPASVRAAYEYLADPRNRPEWQSSLRSVCLDDPDAEVAAGMSWSERTEVGVVPRMQITEFEPFRVWAERGAWRGVRADLRLVFTSVDARRCRVRAYVEVLGDGVWSAPAWLAGRLGSFAIAADLRSAGRVLAKRSDPRD